MKEFIKASEDLVLEALYEVKNGDLDRLLWNILYTFEKLSASDKMDKNLSKLKKLLRLKDLENSYNSLHSAYWYLKNKDLNIENISDFAKIVDNKNDEIYELKKDIEKEG